MPLNVDILSLQNEPASPCVLSFSHLSRSWSDSLFDKKVPVEESCSKQKQALLVFQGTQAFFLHSDSVFLPKPERSAANQNKVKEGEGGI